MALYFYNKAKEMYTDKEINIIDFRYKGTIPNSKETAVLMLADAIEATVQWKNNAQNQAGIEHDIICNEFDSE
ncbi:hypothetical protein R83H12_02907 [Fibrobacteria bacterium R8-3-H12]